MGVDEFLDELRNVIEQLPVALPPKPPDGSLKYVDIDTTALRRAYHNMPEESRNAIRQEWEDVGSYLRMMSGLHGLLRAAYSECAHALHPGPKLVLVPPPDNAASPFPTTGPLSLVTDPTGDDIPLSDRDALMRELRSIVAAMPVITPTSPEPPFYPTITSGPEFDSNRLWRVYHQWAENRTVTERVAIAGLWAEIGSWLYDVNQMTRVGHDLCYHFGVALRVIDDEAADREWRDMFDTPEPRQPHPVDQADDAATPDEPPPDRQRRPRSHWIAAGLGTFALAAAVAVLALLPSDERLSHRVQRPAPDNAIQAIPSLPITKHDFAICEPTPTNPSIEARRPARPAPASATPRRRKASTVRFVADMDSVIVKRRGKPNLRVTIQEEKVSQVTADEAVPDNLSDEDSPSRQVPARIRTVDIDEIKGFGLEIPIGDENSEGRVSVEFAE